MNGIMKKALSKYWKEYMRMVLVEKETILIIYRFFLFTIMSVLVFIKIVINIDNITAMILESLLVVAIFIITIMIIVFVACVLFEIPKEIVYMGIEDLDRKVDSWFSEKFNALDNHVDNYSNHRKYFNWEKIPKDNYVIDYYSYKLKNKNIMLLVLIPVLASFLWKSFMATIALVNHSLLLFELNELIDFFEFIKTSFYSGVGEQSMIRLFELMSIAYFLIVYIAEIEKIQKNLNKIEFIKKIKLYESDLEKEKKNR